MSDHEIRTRLTAGAVRRARWPCTRARVLPILDERDGAGHSFDSLPEMAWLLLGTSSQGLLWFPSAPNNFGDCDGLTEFAILVPLLKLVSQEQTGLQ